jgi:hypothetical protein
LDIGKSIERVSGNGGANDIRAYIFDGNIFWLIVFDDGVLFAASKLRLTNVTFSGNSAYYRGGGMYNHVSSDCFKIGKLHMKRQGDRNPEIKCDQVTRVVKFNPSAR